ncbi:MAG: hypothetical protein KKF62_02810 [Bacteroidetes bacterium]|nr:hypothetical protein [Bacteroidota bacterium]MBU1113722.1 hypothetical protein [Bacteroidota bacterium]MBU1799378.1 hypothetical protein [Bacteroidota bacterium]
MKKTLIISFLATLIFTSCSEEPKTVLFNSEAFAFSIGDGWEINASVNAKGFAQIEKDNSELYFTNLYYSVNLYTPEDTIYNADYGSVIDSTNEEILDKQIESQIELDSGFIAGNYLIEFIVHDNYSNTKDTLSTKLVLE